MASEDSQSSDSAAALPGVTSGALDVSSLPKRLDLVLLADSTNSHAFLAGLSKALGMERVRLPGAPEAVRFFAQRGTLLVLPANVSDFLPSQSGESTKSLADLRGRLPELLDAISGRGAPGLRCVALTDVHADAGTGELLAEKFGVPCKEVAASATARKSAVIELDARTAFASSGCGAHGAAVVPGAPKLGAISSAVLERGYFRDPLSEGPEAGAVEDCPARGSLPRFLCYAVLRDASSPYASESAAWAFSQVPAVCELVRASAKLPPLCNDASVVAAVVSSVSAESREAGVTGEASELPVHSFPDGSGYRGVLARVKRAVSATVRAMTSVSGGFYV